MYLRYSYAEILANDMKNSFWNNKSFHKKTKLPYSFGNLVNNAAVETKQFKLCGNFKSG